MGHEVIVMNISNFDESLLKIISGITFFILLEKIFGIVWYDVLDRLIGIKWLTLSELSVLGIRVTMPYWFL